MELSGLGIWLMVIASFIIQCLGRPWPPPPDYKDKAKTARYLAHYADWGVVSALSPEFGGVPFGTIQSFADGPMGNSSGTPYFYIADISDTYINIKYNNSVSLAITRAESSDCEKLGLDPESPLCARITLVGKIVEVTDKEEMNFAKVGLWDRHPAMSYWPSGHGWKFYKLEITATSLLDYYGGASHISVKDYYAANPFYTPDNKVKKTEPQDSHVNEILKRMH